MSEVKPVPEATPPEPPASAVQRIAAMLRVVVRLPHLVLTIIDNQKKIAEAFNKQTALVHQLGARVNWYEHRVPLIAKEYLTFKHHEKRMIERAQAAANYEQREARRADMQLVEAGK
jgi:response regulator RpfG family c-di-GMP phosphodiesterase